MVRHGGGLFERAAVLEIGRDPGCVEAVIAELGGNARRCRRRRPRLLRGDGGSLVGGREIAAAGGALILVNRALILSRRQRHPHRERHQPWCQARLADNQLLVEFLDALFEPEQRPGIGGANWYSRKR